MLVFGGDARMKGQRILTIGAMFLAMSIPGAGRGGQQPVDVPPIDHSDWWSITGQERSADEPKPQNRELEKSNFQILGIDLNADAYAEAVKTLEFTQVVRRGDAANGREQACYVSAESKHATYLIFERGEVNAAFYLFSETTPWKGRELCARSDRVSKSIHTESGLRLGLTPAQVIAILGEPSERKANELVYFTSVKKDSSAKDLASARKEHPELNENEIKEDYGTYDESVDVHARFVHSRMTYLGVSMAQTN